MTYLLDVPVEGGGRLLVQASEDELPGGLELAALRPGEVVARVEKSLEQALDQLRPAVAAVRDRLAAVAPDEMAVEFGIVLGAETGVVVAKGTAAVHFTVSLTWRQPRADPAGLAGDGSDRA
ncbi:MAG TPA: CU044_2847 family protein [Micromonosporaceae bacterium]|nr:CU044_2847 family protein [Micromonosporaceae bacterium]